jgi:enamine deaminase RidA (YjgF/YER057c/UK114 family)
MSDRLRPGTGIREVNATGISAGPGYSHAVTADIPGRLVILSGQIPLNVDGELVGAGDLRAQTRQVFANLGAALAAADASWEHVVKLGYFMRDVSQVGVVRAVREETLPAGIEPAATLIEVSRLVRDDLLIEIEALAIVPTG